MLQVSITYKNGNRAVFYATEFDLDERELRSGKSYLHRFTYKDSTGEDVPFFLLPDEVSGIIVNSTDEGGQGTALGG